MAVLRLPAQEVTGFEVGEPPEVPKVLNGVSVLVASPAPKAPAFALPRPNPEAVVSPTGRTRPGIFAPVGA